MGLINTAIEGGDIIVTADGTDEKITLPLDPRSPNPSLFSVSISLVLSLFFILQSLISSPDFLKSLEITPTLDLFGTSVRPRILPSQSSFFASFLLVPSCKLVYLGPDPRPIIINRPPPTAQNGSTVITAFADAGPYLLASETSFEHVNRQLEKKIEIVR
jgi:hypothetical protein